MFTHADFNRDGRQIGRAWLSRPTWRIATVWRFECGDIAYWVRGQFIAWPHQVQLWGLSSTSDIGRLFDRGQLGELGTRIDG